MNLDENPHELILKTPSRAMTSRHPALGESEAKSIKQESANKSTQGGKVTCNCKKS